MSCGSLCSAQMMFLSLFFYFFWCQYRKKRHVFFTELLICVIVALETGDGGGWAERRGARVCVRVCVFSIPFKKYDFWDPFEYKQQC